MTAVPTIQMTNQKTLRAGILGAGFMGMQHAQSLKAADRVTVAAVCEKRIDFAHQLIAKAGLAEAKAYGDFAAMLQAESLDILYVCIPPHAHEGEAETAAARGIHVFLEKPIAFDSRRARAVVEAIERAGVASQVGFHYRFRKSVRRLRELIAAGEAGQPTLFSGRYWTNFEGSEWWRDQNRSRGQIYEQLIHMYDLAIHLLGTPSAASGWMANLQHRGTAGYTIEDTSIGTLQFQNGSMAVVTGSNCAVPVHFMGDFGVVFSKATLQYSCTGQTWVNPDQAVLHRAEVKETFVEDEPAYLLETQNFIQAIREGHNRTLTPARQGLTAIEAVEKVMASAAVAGLPQPIGW